MGPVERNDIIYKKDTKFFCNYCNDFVMQLCRDVFSDEVFMVSQFYNDKGQAPFVSGSKFLCKKCGKPLDPFLMKTDRANGR